MKLNRILISFLCVALCATNLYASKISVTIMGPNSEAGTLQITPNVESYDAGTMLHLVATANLGYRFGGSLEIYRLKTSWDGSVYESDERIAYSGKNTMDFVMPDYDISIKVYFSETAHKYSTNSGFTLLSAENGCATGAEYFYDVDSNGVMEYIKDQTTQTSEYINGSWEYFTKYHPTVYDMKNREVSWKEKGAYRPMIALDDINRDGKLDLIQKGLDRDGNYTGWIYFTSFETGEVTDSLYVYSSLYDSQPPSLFLSGCVALDANADGRTDYYFYNSTSGVVNPHRIAYQRTDGSFYLRDMEIVTDEEEIDNELFAQYGANPIVYTIHFGGASLAKSPARRGLSAAPKKVAEFFTESSHPTAIDINMDGLPDLLNLNNGDALFSMGNGRYYYGSFGGEVTAKDVSGDGIPDFIVYNEKAKTVYLYI